jgi:type II secretory pathway pseudopilin PulG
LAVGGAIQPGVAFDIGAPTGVANFRWQSRRQRRQLRHLVKMVRQAIQQAQRRDQQASPFVADGSNPHLLTIASTRSPAACSITCPTQATCQRISSRSSNRAERSSLPKTTNPSSADLHGMMKPFRSDQRRERSLDLAR